MRRTESLRQLLRDRKLDGYIITNLADLYYFTDYWSEGYYGLVGLEESWLFLPNLLYEQAKAVTVDFHCLKGRLDPLLTQVLKKNRLKKVGFDPQQVSYSLGEWLQKKGLVPKAGLVGQLRRIKDGLDLKRLRKANHLAALGAEYVRHHLKPGVRERKVAADLAHFFSTRAHGISFDLIIAAGANGAFPHHITSDYRIQKGDPVICDIGALWEGYHSDLTRTFPLGKMTPSFRRVFAIVAKAQEEGIKRLKPGVRAGDVDRASRRVIERRGLGRYFCHSTGHGVGIDIHEHPRIGPGVKDKLEAGMVVTVEPGIYLPGQFGVRIEDTLLVTPNGSERLTK